MISVKKFTFNPFQENTYVLYDETKECVIIDPGCFERHEKKELDDFIEGNELKPVHLLQTHCHIDHVFGSKHVAEKYILPLEVHEKDLPVLNSIEQVAQVYGFGHMELPPSAGKFLKEGEQVSFGSSSLDILFVPGHCPGHVAFVAKEEKLVVQGDVLFYGSIGRTDLPGGDFNTLINSIKTELFALPDDFTVYTGHGPETTIGFEKQNNPFLNN